MNAYEFIRKGYGDGDLRPLNLHIFVGFSQKSYQVIQVSNLELRLVEHTRRGVEESRYLGRNNLLEVAKVTLVRSARLSEKPKTILQLEEAPRK